jgi:hypothetical protein
MADHVSSDSFAVAERDDTGEMHLTLVTDDGSVELVGEPRAVLHLVVDADLQLSREAQQ